MPLVVLLGVALFFMVKKGGAKFGHALLATLFGLALAGTSVGEPILSTMNTATQAAVEALSEATR